MNRIETIASPTASLVLVAFVDDPEIDEWLRTRLDLFCSKHPTNVVILDATRAHAQGVDESHWKTIGVSDIDVLDLSQLVRSLAPHGMHLSLLWSAQHVNDARFIELAEESDSVLVDSSRSAGNLDELRRLVGYLAGRDERSIQDLTYLRLVHWQEMIASFFDERIHLDGIDSITSVDILAGSDAQAYYLLGWLSQRLDWTAGEPGVLTNRLGNPVRYSIRREGSPQSVRRLMLTSPTHTFNARLSGRDEHLVLLEITGKHARATRAEHLVDLDIIALFERAFLLRETAPLFHATLEQTAQLLGSGNKSS